MKGLTKWALMLTILAVGTYIPIIVVLNILRGGSYWSLLDLVWGFPIILVSSVLLKSVREGGK